MKKNKKRDWFSVVASIVAVIIFLSGFGIFMYPKISNFLYERRTREQHEEFSRQTAVAAEYVPSKGEDEPEAKKPGILDELYEKMQEENLNLFENKQEKLRDPWDYEQPAIDLSSYGLKDNIVGYITIPRMKIELPVLLGANYENMRYGAGHLTETSYPIGGENTNCVLAAHRGFSGAEMFRNIEELQLGDRIYLENFREVLIYEVTELQVIKPDDTEKIMIRPGEELLTLLTCHPLGQHYQRYMVVCSRVTDEPSETE